MIYEHDPITAEAPKKGPFWQSIRLCSGEALIGQVRWHLSGSSGEGVMQILDLIVEPPYRRRGHGTQLMKEAFAQAAVLFRMRRSKLRRAWIAMEQKEQVIGRAMLTGLGFHHIATVANLLRDQDQLIYVRTFD